ncbi:MAG: hypothetical protein OXH52_07995 [Gammaproteobacteria bacterium]|nr:hypothetical protein [Gammaproteobacteria bacterium]
MERFAFPRLGRLSVSEVTSADVVEALRAVWHERPATAWRARQRISTVMEWAVALNYGDDNPCSRIGPVLDPLRDLVQHMRALPRRDVAAVVEEVRGIEGDGHRQAGVRVFWCSPQRGAARCAGRCGPRSATTNGTIPSRRRGPRRNASTVCR